MKMAMPFTMPKCDFPTGKTGSSGVSRNAEVPGLSRNLAVPGQSRLAAVPGVCRIAAVPGVCRIAAVPSRSLPRQTLDYAQGKTQ